MLVLLRISKGLSKRKVAMPEATLCKSEVRFRIKGPNQSTSSDSVLAEMIEILLDSMLKKVHTDRIQIFHSG